MCLTVDSARAAAQDYVTLIKWIVRVAIGFAYLQRIAHVGAMRDDVRNVDSPTAGMVQFVLTVATRPMCDLIKYDVMQYSQFYKIPH